jgi:hypothetical protein
MTWLEFFSNIIDNILSWPVAVLFIVLVLRKELGELFHTVENFVLEAGGTRVSFTRNLERAKERAAAATAGVLPSPTGSDTSGNLDGEQADLDEPVAGTRNRIPLDNDVLRKADQSLRNEYWYTTELAQTRPSFAMQSAWHRLIGDPIRRLADEKDVPPAGDTLYLLNELNSRGVVPDAIVDSARNLNYALFQVAPARREPSPSEAVEYAQIALEVGRYLNYLRSEDSEPQPPR